MSAFNFYVINSPLPADSQNIIGAAKKNFPSGLARFDK
jgi:hypothetical protein